MTFLSPALAPRCSSRFPCWSCSPCARCAARAAGCPRVEAEGVPASCAPRRGRPPGARPGGPRALASFGPAVRGVPPGRVAERRGGAARPRPAGRRGRPRPAPSARTPPPWCASARTRSWRSSRRGSRPPRREATTWTPAPPTSAAPSSSPSRRRPRAVPPRIVLLTDGNENRGSAAQAAAVARSFGARIFPVPLAAAPAARGRRRAPARGVGGGHPRARRACARESRTRSPSWCEAAGTRPRRVTLFRDGQPVATREALLGARGERGAVLRRASPSGACTPGTRWWRRPRDGTAQNNHYRRLVEVTGTPQVLYVSRPGHDSPALLSALRRRGSPW